MESRPVVVYNTDTQFPLSRLPTELRIEIYKYVLTREQPITPYESARRGFSDFIRYRHEAHPAALIQVNRQIRAEAQLIFYNRMSFSIGHCLIFARWLSTLSNKQIDAIEHIQLCISADIFVPNVVKGCEAESWVTGWRDKLQRLGVKEPQKVEFVQWHTGESMLWLRGRKDAVHVDAASSA